MASITKRIKADAAVVYDAAIKIRKHGEIVHREKRSFTKQKLAKDWAMRNKEAKPQTVKNDVIWLKVALSTIKGLHNYDYSLDMFESATR